MDLLENGIRAGANEIRLSILEEGENGLLRILVKDNGKGLGAEEVERILDPFFTTKQGKRVGLGLPLFLETCRRCGGDLRIDSSPSKGTLVEGWLRLDNIDLPPYGDIGGAIAGILLGNPHLDMVLEFMVDNKRFFLDTRDLKLWEDQGLCALRLIELRDTIREFFNKGKD